ncbi:hypothetical protein L2E82_13589 [Cichorium intybus]|uniref:Uncharacterized protein n=1 Tax=Cichorium intybus TaxID=13427 RepID=A0ACB9EX40_CICIN|nr:hypothetical protein L2E82_13589 [Cichorium intybus]
MATCLKRRTSNLLSQKPRIFSSFFAERWFGILSYQDHLTHKPNTSIFRDLASITDGLRASFSTCSESINEPVVTDAPSNIPDEKQIPLQDQLPPKTCFDLFINWGCNHHETTQIFDRMPSLHKSKLDKLQSKLKVLQDLGFTSSDLVKIVSCRPRFLRSRLNNCLDERVHYLENVFGSKLTLQKAILRNPSILTYDLKKMIKPTIELYKSMGITGDDLTLMLLSRPTIIPRTSLTPEKLDCIRRTGASKDSKMYKYVVTLIAISRIETIREKIANLEKFGFLEDEVFRLFGSSPLVLTLSVDKVQRNMTFVVASMKLSAKVVLSHPFLLFNNLETVMKPRMIVAAKIEDLGLVPRIEGARVFTALRMTERRFVKAFIDCHPLEVSKVLMECYSDAKHVRRLAQESKKVLHKGFPF